MQLRLLQSYLITIGAQMEGMDKQKKGQLSDKNKIQSRTTIITQVVKSNNGTLE